MITPLPRLVPTDPNFQPNVDDYFGNRIPTFCEQTNATAAAINLVAIAVDGAQQAGEQALADIETARASSLDQIQTLRNESVSAIGTQLVAAAEIERDTSANAAAAHASAQNAAASAAAAEAGQSLALMHATALYF